MKVFFWLWVFLALVLSNNARADLRFEGFSPANPSEESMVNIRVWSSAGLRSNGSVNILFCDYADFTLEEITKTGNVIRAQFVTQRFPTASGQGCPAAGSGMPYIREYSIGQLNAGSYTLELVARDVLSPARPIIHVASVPISVGTNQFVHVPLATPLALAGLALALMAFGIMRLSGKLKVTALLILFGNLHASESNPTNPERAIVEIMLKSGEGYPSADAVLAAGDRGTIVPGFEDAGARNLRIALPERPSIENQMWLRENPDTPIAQLNRIIFVDVSNRAAAERLINTLRADSNVQSAYLLPNARFAAGPTASPSQAGQHSIRADLARRWQSGWALIGTADSGIMTGHPELAAFDAVNGSIFRDAGNYIGGNFLWVYSGDDQRGDRNVDERVCATASNSYVSETCFVSGNRKLGFQPLFNQNCPSGTLQASFVGHGTHQVGIAVASAANLITNNYGLDFSGICNGCGLAHRRIVYLDCLYNEFGNYSVTPSIDISTLAAAITKLASMGVQVISLSMEARREGVIERICPGNNSVQGSVAICQAIQYAKQRGAVVVAAAGNEALELAFPASEPSVIPAMGFDPNYNPNGNNEIFWLQPPGNQCPNFGSLGFCGSNFGSPLTTSPSEYLGYAVVQAPAKEIRSTFYFGQVWNSFGECESYEHSYSSLGIFPTNNASYYGRCTGTSMAAPAVGAVAALVRSTNPLLPVGEVSFDNFASINGVQDVLAKTARTPANYSSLTFPNTPLTISAQQAWGYGIIDAEAAIKKTLGVVAGTNVKHRLIPLFQLRSNSNDDYAYTTSPQSAVTLLATQGPSYSSVGAAIGGYSNFAASGQSLESEEFLEEQVFDPRADLFLLANDYRTQNGDPDPEMPLDLADDEQYNVEPLFWMSRCRFLPIGCGVHGFHEAEILLALTRELTDLNALGYELRGRVGFVIACRTAVCESGAPTDPSLERVYRVWKGTSLGSADAAFIGASHLSNPIYSSYSTTTLPTTGSGLPNVPTWPQVYAFRNIDTDADTLIDGQELLAGTNDQASNSDCDAQADGVEFPVAGVSLSDPMSSTTCADRRVRIYREDDQVKMEMSNFGPTTISGAVFYFQGGSQLTLGVLNTPLPSQCVTVVVPPKYPIPGPGPRHSYRCTFPTMASGTKVTISYDVSFATTGMPYPSQAAYYLGEVETFGTPSTDPASGNDTATFSY